MSASGTIAADDGCRIAWRADGPSDARVLLLSNSLGTDMDMWFRQVDAFAGQFRVLRYDARGHGASGATPGDYSLDRLGRDALALLDALGVARIDFCGVSLGGMIGQWLAWRAPERLGRIVLSNTSAFMGPPAGWQTRIDAVRRDGMAVIADAMLPRWLTERFAALRPDVATALIATLKATDPQGYAGCCAAIRDMDLRPTARLVTTPALVIGGSEDPATPPGHAIALADHLQGAILLMLPAAHLANIEAPDAFNEAVLDFLGNTR